MKTYTAYFNRFDLELPAQAIADCHHTGRCDSDVAFWEPQIDLSAIDPDDIRAELEECGAWDDSELANDQDNRERLIWIAAGNIQEEDPDWAQVSC